MPHASSQFASSILPLFHWGGWLGWVVLIALIVALLSCRAPNRSEQQIASYRADIARTGGEQALEIPVEIEALVSFLEEMGKAGVVANRTSEVYAENAVLNDTLARVEGAEAIRDHFAKTMKSMNHYEVSIEDISRSGPDWYLRWIMVYSADSLAGGTPVHSIGITQARLNESGKVILHQDFWDSTSVFFQHILVLESGIQAVHKRL